MAIVSGGAWRASTAMDPDYDGPGQIAGTVPGTTDTASVAVVDPDGTPERPLRRRVCLIDRRSLRVVRSILPDAVTGAYAFPCVRRDIAWMLLADDHTGRYNAVVSDWVRARV